VFQLAVRHFQSRRRHCRLRVHLDQVRDLASATDLRLDRLQQSSVVARLKVCASKRVGGPALEQRFRLKHAHQADGVLIGRFGGQNALDQFESRVRVARVLYQHLRKAHLQHAVGAVTRQGQSLPEHLDLIVPASKLTEYLVLPREHLVTIRVDQQIGAVMQGRGSRVVQMLERDVAGQTPHSRDIVVVDHVLDCRGDNHVRGLPHVACLRDAGQQFQCRSISGHRRQRVADVPQRALVLPHPFGLHRAGPNQQGRPGDRVGRQVGLSTKDVDQFVVLAGGDKHGFESKRGVDCAIPSGHQIQKSGSGLFVARIEIDHLPVPFKRLDGASHPAVKHPGDTQVHGCPARFVLKRFLAGRVELQQVVEVRRLSQQNRQPFKREIVRRFQFKDHLKRGYRGVAVLKPGLENRRGLLQ